MSGYRYSDTGEHGGSSDLLFNRCTKEIGSFPDEIRRGIRDIASRSTRPLWICHSGGLASEIMCQLFFEEGVNFSVMTLHYTDGSNEHGVTAVARWCGAHQVTQVVESLALQEFMAQDVARFQKDGYATNKLSTYIQLRLLEIIEARGGSGVLGGGHVYYTINDSGPRSEPLWSNVFMYGGNTRVPLQWNSRHESAHEPFFYFSTPELCAAYYRSPLFAFALGHTEFFANRKGAPLIRQLILQTIPIKATPQMNHHLPKLGEIPYESAPLSLNARSNTSGTGQSHWYLDEIFAQLGITNEA